jgi:PIN domain nuclease of toxin-antitoxin system
VSRLLLDTHELLWWTTDDDRLPTSARNAIAAAEVVYASDATLWELCVKSSIGKLHLRPNAATWFEQQLRLARFTRLGIAPRHIAAVESLPLHHRDPFDRLLICQAFEENLTVVTTDGKFAAYEVPTLW